MIEFHGISSLDMAKLKKLKGNNLKKLMEAMKKNYSLTSFNYEHNDIDVESFNSIFNFFEENHVLMKIKVTIP